MDTTELRNLVITIVSLVISVVAAKDPSGFLSNAQIDTAITALAAAIALWAAGHFIHGTVTKATASKP